MSSLNSIGQSIFQLESGNGNVDGQTTDEKGQLNRENYTSFESNLAMIVIYLPVKCEFDWIWIYLLFYVVFSSHGHIAMGSLQVEETSAYCTANHQASASNYQLSNMN